MEEHGTVELLGYPKISRMDHCPYTYNGLWEPQKKSINLESSL